MKTKGVLWAILASVLVAAFTAAPARSEPQGSDADFLNDEKLKIEQRIPAAQAYIAAHGLNESFDGARSEIGLIVQGGLYNALVRALQQLGLADAFGASELPLLVLNVTYPLVPVT